MYVVLVYTVYMVINESKVVISTVLIKLRTTEVHVC